MGSTEALVNGWAWGLAGLAASFLGLRIYCRLYRHSGLWWDDDILVLAWMVMMVGVGFTTGMLDNGFLAVPPAPTGEWMYKVTSVCLGLAAAWTKTAFALTLYRMASHWIDRAFLIFAMVTVNGIYILASFAAWVRGCEASEAIAGTYLPGGCWTATTVISISSAAIAWSGLLDFVLAIYPWRLIWGLDMRKAEKIGLCVAMSLGVLAGIVVVIRLVLMANLVHSTNLNHDMAIVTITNVAEPSVSILAQSLPIFRVLFRSMRSTHAPSDSESVGQYSETPNSADLGSYAVANDSDIQPYSAIQGNQGRAERSLTLTKGPNGHYLQDKARRESSYFDTR